MPTPHGLAGSRRWVYAETKAMRRERLSTGDALLLVDVQLDFLPGGALGVRHGDAVIAPLNAAIERFRAAGLPIYASRDWHPPDHCSFVAQGGPWPVHCVAESPGAAFAPALALPPDARIVSKATEVGRDAYSAFDGTDLAERLREDGVRRLFIGGLATDYCVRWTVQDALAYGYEVVVLRDAVRAVEVRPGDGARALRAIQRRGAGVRGGIGAETGPPNKTRRQVIVRDSG
jgi:nicotinamidase/pyrazinamidase